MASKRGKIRPGSIKSGPGKGKFPVVTQHDVTDAARLAGRAKGVSKARVIAHIKAEAKRRGLTLPASYKLAATGDQDILLGKYGSKWKHGYIPLNPAAVALKKKTMHGHDRRQRALAQHIRTEAGIRAYAKREGMNQPGDIAKVRAEYHGGGPTREVIDARLKALKIRANASRSKDRTAKVKSTRGVSKMKVKGSEIDHAAMQREREAKIVAAGGNPAPFGRDRFGNPKPEPSVEERLSGKATHVEKGVRVANGSHRAYELENGKAEVHDASGRVVSTHNSLRAATIERNRLNKAETSNGSTVVGKSAEGKPVIVAQQRHVDASPKKITDDDADHLFGAPITSSHKDAQTARQPQTTRIVKATYRGEQGHLVHGKFANGHKGSKVFVPGSRDAAFVVSANLRDGREPFADHPTLGKFSDYNATPDAAGVVPSHKMAPTLENQAKTRRAIATSLGIPASHVEYHEGSTYRVTSGPKAGLYNLRGLPRGGVKANKIGPLPDGQVTWQRATRGSMGERITSTGMAPPKPAVKSTRTPTGRKIPAGFEGASDPHGRLRDVNGRMLVIYGQGSDPSVAPGAANQFVVRPNSGGSGVLGTITHNDDGTFDVEGVKDTMPRHTVKDQKQALAAMAALDTVNEHKRNQAAAAEQARRDAMKAEADAKRAAADTERQAAQRTARLAEAKREMGKADAERNRMAKVRTGGSKSKPTTKDTATLQKARETLAARLDSSNATDITGGIKDASKTISPGQTVKFRTADQPMRKFKATDSGYGSKFNPVSQRYEHTNFTEHTGPNGEKFTTDYNGVVLSGDEKSLLKDHPEDFHRVDGVGGDPRTWVKFHGDPKIVGEERTGHVSHVGTGKYGEVHIVSVNPKTGKQEIHVQSGNSRSAELQDLAAQRKQIEAGYAPRVGTHAGDRRVKGRLYERGDYANGHTSMASLMRAADEEFRRRMDAKKAASGEKVTPRDKYGLNYVGMSAAELAKHLKNGDPGAAAENERRMKNAARRRHLSGAR